jgi:hypothetical protein
VLLVEVYLFDHGTETYRAKLVKDVENRLYRRQTPWKT